MATEGVLAGATWGRHPHWTSQCQSRPRRCSWRGKTRHARPFATEDVCCALVRSFGANVNGKTHLFWAALICTHVPMQKVECKLAPERFARSPFHEMFCTTKHTRACAALSNVNSGLSDQVIREDPAGAVVVRAWPGHRNIGRGSCRSALADGVERRSTAVVLG